MEFLLDSENVQEVTCEFTTFYSLSLQLRNKMMQTTFLYTSDIGDISEISYNTFDRWIKMKIEPYYCYFYLEK